MVNGRLEGVLVYPDKMWQRFTIAPGVTLDTWVTPSLSISIADENGQKRYLPAEDGDEAIKSIRTDPVWVVQHMGQPGYSLTVAGSEQVGTYSTRILEVSAVGAENRWNVEPQSGHIVRSAAQRMGSDGLAEEITGYANWRSFGGYVQPVNLQTTRRGVLVRSGQLLTFELNPTIDDKIWQLPPGY